MYAIDERPASGQCQQATNARECARVTPHAQNAKNRKRRSDGIQFANFQRNKARNQDSRGDGSQRREQGFAQEDYSNCTEDHVEEG